MQHRTRNRPLCRVALLLILGALAIGPAFALGFDDIAREADRLAHLPYRQPPAADPALAALRYGVSARGLAVDTVGAGAEEFPAFTTFWVVRPKPGDDAVRCFALLESPRVTGAYAFTVRPGPSTTIDVRARLTLRAPVARLGI